MFRSFTRLKVDKRLWDKVVKDIGRSKDREEIVHEIFKGYSSLKGVVNENRRLKASLEDLKADHRELQKEHERLKEEVDRNRREYDSLRKSHNRLRKDYKVLQDNPVVKEKVVYKEDTAKIEAIAQKRDALQKRCWKKIKELEQLENERGMIEKEVSRLKEELETCKRKHFAILVRKEPGASQFLEGEVQAELLDSKEYYRWKAEKDKYEKEKDLKTQFYFIQIIQD